MTTDKIEVVDQGNEDNMAKIREAMEQSKKVNMGSQLTEGVDIDFTTTFGTHYVGRIVFKRPSMQDYMKMGSIKAQMIGQNGAVDIRLVDSTIKYMATAMSTLLVVVTQAPEWMIVKGRISVEHFKEPDILYHIFGKYEDWEEAFRKPVPAPLQGDSETTEGA